MQSDYLKAEALATVVNSADSEALSERFGDSAEVALDSRGNPVRVNGYPVKRVRAGFNNTGMKVSYRYETDFMEYPFWNAATDYDGNLAVMSLIMALSANRSIGFADISDKDFDPALNVVDFLEDAGFSDIRKDDYSKVPTMYTVSTAIGARVMEAEEQEPFTLIAVGVCGGGYRNEWESNLTPGEGRLHEGFANASQLVVDRLSGYIATRQIRGRIKVWISGFSRAAAIANVTAGTLVNTGMFPKEDVYAYTFATPSAVENPPETGYENIFNIIDPMDLIPQVMPAEWGFGRYGRNLYLSVQEFTSFMGLYWTMLRAQTGRTLYRAESNYSPALNLRTRLLFGLLIDALSSRERFNEQFQPALVGIMQNKTASNVLGTLRNLMRNLSDATVGEQARLDALMDYFIRVFDAVLSRRGLRGTDSNAGSAAFRLFTEHTENAYLSDMSEIRSGEFGDNDRFSYVMVQGPVSLSIGDEEYIAVETLAPDGSRTHDAILDVLSEYYDDPNAVFYMERIGDTSVVAVPMDAPYTVTWRAEADGSVQSVYVRVKTEAGSRFEGMMSPVLTVKAGETGVAFRGEGGEALPLEGF